MLTSRQAEVKKRDRLTQKGQDGGSFTPKAVTISGTTPSATSMSIPLPKYINFDNFLGSFFIHNGGGHSGISNTQWLQNYHDEDPMIVSYNNSTNVILVNGIGSATQAKQF